MGKTVGIIGAGPGGLAAGLLLQTSGHSVEIFETLPEVGGRNGRIVLGDFRFDVGPTFFLMPQILRDVFERSKMKLEDYLDLKRIEPMYTLDYGVGGILRAYSDPERMADSIATFSRHDRDWFFTYRERQRRKFEALLPALKQPFSKWRTYLKRENFAALPFLDNGSVYDELENHFEDERVRLAFTFQAKYLGMSPFDCPSLFTILPHIEHSEGVWHPRGGCNQVTHGLARAFRSAGGHIRCGQRVTKVLATRGRVRGFTDSAGQERLFDSTIMNADFAYGMSELFTDDERGKYKNARLNRLKLSCSTFMLYLGLRENPALPHHSIYFAQNYRRNLRELTGTLELSEDPSFYLHNPVVTDPSVAPAGKSALYVLVPVPNLGAQIDWVKERERYRALILGKIKARTGIDLEPLIEVEKCVTPLDWQNEYSVYKGATFSLSHSFDQLLNFRPHNASEDFRDLYIVGGGTHPGSGLPTILQSGIIASELISEAQPKRRARFFARTEATL